MIPGESNIADEATRGVETPIISPIRFQGPEFLWQHDPELKHTKR